MTKNPSYLNSAVPVYVKTHFPFSPSEQSDVFCIATAK